MSREVVTYKDVTVVAPKKEEGWIQGKDTTDGIIRFWKGHYYFTANQTIEVRFGQR